MPHNRKKRDIVQDISTQRAYAVTQDNYFLAKSRTESLTIEQRRLLLYLISKIQPDDTELRTYCFSIEEFARVCNLPPKNRTDIKRNLKELANMRWWFDDGEEEFLCSWLADGKGKTSIRKGTNVISVTLSESLKPYLLQLARDFTNIQLAWLVSLHGKYSLPLYQFACSRHYHTHSCVRVTVSVKELQAMMGSKYAEFRDFNSRALKPAIDDINNHTDKHIEIKYIRSGRTITDIELIITRQPEDIVSERWAIADAWGEEYAGNA